MHIAILDSNTDRSEFAQQWPDDFDKFSILLKEVQPEWRFSHFDMIFEQHPEDLSLYDGYIITGSPASVNSDEVWIHSEIDIVKALMRLEKPLFGACFGHQLIAKALGSEVIYNPGGWVFGTIKTHAVNRAEWQLSEANEQAEAWNMYAAHTEQVATLPKGATLLCQNAECAIGGFAMGRSIFTTQYHPEMTDDFIEALVVEIKDEVGPEVAKRASKSLAVPSDRALFAHWICQFFETATTARPV